MYILKTFSVFCVIFQLNLLFNVLSIDEGQLVILSDRVQMETSVKLCELFKMKLIRIDDEYTNDVIYNYANIRKLDRFWIDATDVKKEGRWKNVDEKNLEYTNWKPGKPTTDARINCAYMTGSSETFWDVVNCEYNLMVICYYEIEPPEVTISLDTKRLVILPDFATYHMAIDICKSLDMNLTKITDVNINEIVHAYIRERTNSKFWIDGNDLDVPGQYMYHDGTRMTYTKFPMNDASKSIKDHCIVGSKYLDGWWGHSICTYPNRVVCYQ